MFKVSKEGCGVEEVGIFPSWFNEIKGLAIYATQDEINTARYQKQDLTCVALFKEKETDFLKGIYFEGQMYRNREKKPQMPHKWEDEDSRKHTDF